MYKFLPHHEYDAHNIEQDEQGMDVKVYTNPLRINHPNARVSPDGTEVVISTNHHGGGCDCITQEQAKAYIQEHWVTPESELDTMESEPDSPMNEPSKGVIEL